MSLILLNSDFEVENRFQYSWNILKAVEKDIGYSWNILEYVEKALGYSWSYEVWVERALEYSWNIKDWIKKQLEYSWNIFATVITSETFIKYEFSSAKRPNAFYIDILNKVIGLRAAIICPCECEEVVIGYTSQQMAINEEQPLTVENSIEDCIYNWEIISGGGSLSHASGLSTVYTAPSENPNCDANPTIELSVNGELCDSLDIAVNEYGLAGAYLKIYKVGDQCYRDRYDCDDNYLDRTITSICWVDGAWVNCIEYPGAACTPPGEEIYDLRNAAMIAGGCCPAALL